MGRPIKKIWFGTPVTAGSGHIKVNGVKFADGSTSASAYIIKQTGANAYIVQDTALAHDPEIVFMVNATGLGGLSPGECYILATPFGGSARPCEKIQQFRLSVYNADGTISNYSWSTQPAVALGEADLIITSLANVTLPVVTGTVRVGQVLTTSTGTWSGIAPISYTYVWKRGGVAIGGATASTYTLVLADLGANITVTVTATDGTTATATATSAAVGPVVALPANTVLPVISGLLTNGSALTTTTGTWTGTAPITYTYQWLKAGVPIVGQTTNTYTTVAGDVGALISVNVTGTNTVGGTTITALAVGPIV